MTLTHMPRRVLFAGESPRKSAPTLTAARALQQQVGYEAVFPSADALGHSREWCRLVNTCDAIIVVLYGVPERFFRRHIALAVALGRPVIRWWVGSDVLNVLQDGRIRTAARDFDRFVRTNIAVAPHLCDELASVGLAATFIPSLLNMDDLGVPHDSPNKRSLLVYLPSSRIEFYGFQIVQQIVEQNQDIEFIVVGDETHSLSAHSHVKSLGWVTDMTSVWDRVGGLLRVTTHDGMPRMVLEALRREKHVIYAWPFPGCRLARTPEEVQAAVVEFKGYEGKNRIGAAAVRCVLEPNPAIRFANEIESALSSVRLSLLCRAAGAIVADTIRLKLRPE